MTNSRNRIILIFSKCCHTQNSKSALGPGTNVTKSEMDFLSQGYTPRCTACTKVCFFNLTFFRFPKRNSKNSFFFQHDETIIHFPFRTISVEDELSISPLIRKNTKIVTFATLHVCHFSSFSSNSTTHHAIKFNIRYTQPCPAFVLRIVMSQVHEHQTLRESYVFPLHSATTGNPLFFNILKYL